MLAGRGCVRSGPKTNEMPRLHIFYGKNIYNLSKKEMGATEMTPPAGWSTIIQHTLNTKRASDGMHAEGSDSQWQ